MAKTIWMCEKCGTTYETEKEATECEAYHYNIAEIKEVIYPRRDLNNSQFPEEITVKLEKGEYSTVATYRFIRIEDYDNVSDDDLPF